MHEAYPLHWPLGYERTPEGERIRSRFKNTLGAARDFLKKEVLDRLKGKDLVISTNLPIKQNGDLYADFGRYKMTDPGVAIYFTYKGKQTTFCCDQYQSVWENIAALAKGIEAIRLLDRHGISQFMDRAFTGFQALPETTGRFERAWEVLNHKPTKDIGLIKKLYLHQAQHRHPDKEGGSNELFTELQDAYKVALEYAGN